MTFVGLTNSPLLVIIQKEYFPAGSASFQAMSFRGLRGVWLRMSGNNRDARQQHAAARSVGQVIQLAEGTTLDHFDLQVSDDGQCLLIYCADNLVAMHSAMGSDVDAFHFPDGTCCTLMDLIRKLGRLT